MENTVCSFGRWAMWVEWTLLWWIIKAFHVWMSMGSLNKYGVTDGASKVWMFKFTVRKKFILTFSWFGTRFTLPHTAKEIDWVWSGVCHRLSECQDTGYMCEVKYAQFLLWSLCKICVDYSPLLQSLHKKQWHWQERQVWSTQEIQQLLEFTCRFQSKYEYLRYIYFYVNKGDGVTGWLL